MPLSPTFRSVIRHLSFVILPLAAVAETGPARADRLLAAMGGRDAWAQVKFVHVEATHDQLSLASPYTNRIWNDFSQRRVRFEARNDEIDSRSGIHGDAGWRWRNGEPQEMTADRLAGEQRWWEANIYRTLHRLAVNDPDLEPRAVGEHRLEIFRRDGVRLNWFLLLPSGAPVLYGTWDRDTGTVFGRLASNGTVNYPKSGGQPDGSWRYEITRFETASRVPPGIDFTTP